MSDHFREPPSLVPPFDSSTRCRYHPGSVTPATPETSHQLHQAPSHQLHRKRCLHMLGLGQRNRKERQGCRHSLCGGNSVLSMEPEAENAACPSFSIFTEDISQLFLYCSGPLIAGPTLPTPQERLPLVCKAVEASRFLSVITLIRNPDHRWLSVVPCSPGSRLTDPRPVTKRLVSKQGSFFLMLISSCVLLPTGQHRDSVSAFWTLIQLPEGAGKEVSDESVEEGPIEGSCQHGPTETEGRKRTPLPLPPRMTRVQKSRPVRLYRDWSRDRLGTCQGPWAVRMLKPCGPAGPLVLGHNSLQGHSRCEFTTERRQQGLIVMELMQTT
ncbi:hypothetical protein E5288_WYG005128 [Bos mutus]|uniref:Uncharacterized protein n=1 Tax=Bos mutus TaxID=72004 RepID=A0A6B0S5R8_9CETA|nr:hypothetical protein [Bos mutus]